MRNFLLFFSILVLTLACSRKTSRNVLVPDGVASFWVCYANETDSIPCSGFYFGATGEYQSFRCPPGLHFLYQETSEEWEKHWEIIGDSMYVIGGVPYTLQEIDDTTLFLSAPQDSITLHKVSSHSKFYKELSDAYKSEK